MNEQRKRLHERIAGAIELVFADRINDHLKDLAHHYCRSNNSLKAIEYLRRAGEQATVRAFYEEAIEQLKSALDLLEKLDNKVRECARTGDPYSVDGTVRRGSFDDRLRGPAKCRASARALRAGRR